MLPSDSIHLPASLYRTIPATFPLLQQGKFPAWSFSGIFCQYIQRYQLLPALGAKPWRWASRTRSWVSSRNFYDVLQKYYYLYVSGVQISRDYILQRHWSREGSLFSSRRQHHLCHLYIDMLSGSCHGSSELETFILEISFTTNKRQVCSHEQESFRCIWYWSI